MQAEPAAGLPAPNGRWPGTVERARRPVRRSAPECFGAMSLACTWPPRHLRMVELQDGCPACRFGQGVRIECRGERSGRSRPRHPDGRWLHGLEVPRRAGRRRRRVGSVHRDKVATRGGGRRAVGTVARRPYHAPGRRRPMAGLGCGLAALWAVTAVITVVVGRPRRSTSVLREPSSWLLPSSPGRQCSSPSGLLRANWRRLAAKHPPTPVPFSALATPCAWSPTRGPASAGPVGVAPRMDRGAPTVTSPHPLALLPIGGLVAVLALFTVRLAGGRDLGASTFPDRAPVRLRTRGSCSARRAWTFASPGRPGGMGRGHRRLRTRARARREVWRKRDSASSTLTRAFSRLGAIGAEAYLGVAFLLMGVFVAFVAAGQISAARGEEAEGRLDNLLVRPVSRPSWLAWRLLFAALVVFAGGLIAGVFSCSEQQASTAG